MHDDGKLNHVFVDYCLAHAPRFDTAPRQARQISSTLKKKSSAEEPNEETATDNKEPREVSSRTIIEVQNVCGRVQYKALKSPHLIWTPLFLVGMSEGLPDFCALRRSRSQQGQRHNFGNQKERSLKNFQGQVLNSFKRRI